ncbi:N-acetyltransferase [Arenicella chitinivorans]|uniref:N-acetyltransferase n=1 Tax=Arenicella chitinivorans TaxID=1329800 RepID=A0A918VND0_9GAMM|nr:arsinothricin resistance N-acetyltransferase ArsN1 family A [Arenicella chitinivorans]GHA10403.1 N-acetyltransferase [Arenicella chitinivorans]
MASTISSAAPITVRLTRPDDATQIRDIYNQGIESGESTFDTTPRSVSDIEPWFNTLDDYPVLVAEQNDQLIGFARIFEYRARACYRQNTEFSIYLTNAARGHGVGTKLLRQLIERAETLGYTKLLSRIFTFNHASLALCRKTGFREVGFYARHGQVNGQWLDVVIVEKLLNQD